MIPFTSYRQRLFWSPAEHGGDSVKSGRPQSAPEAKTTEEVDDALGQTVPGRGKTAGTGDPGVPGSKTNPVEKDKQPEPETDEIGRGPTGVGVAGG